MQETETKARDLAAELAHLKAWWATHADLPPTAISVRASRHRNTLPQILRGERPPTASVLDSCYPWLALYGYQPLSNEYLFL